jgi:hypothetical protein
MMNVKEMSMELKLSYIRENSEALIEEARHLGLDHREFLMLFLEREVLRRKENPNILQKFAINLKALKP